MTDASSSAARELRFAAEEPSRTKERRHFGDVWARHWQLYVMLAPSAVLLLLFHIYPLWGIAIAFFDYNNYQGLSGSQFVGLHVFKQVFSQESTWLIIRKTVIIAIGKIVFGQVASLCFSLMLYEIMSRRFRRIVQTIATLPHFLSWIIIGGIMIQLLSSTGFLTQSLQSIGFGPVGFLSDASIFPWTMIISETWKEFGYGAVIYLAALMQINPEMYEAAAVDGAGRGARLWHVTLPGIAPIVVLLSCLSLGNVLNGGMEQILVLYNPVVYSTGDIIDTWVYRNGLLDAQYSLATAVGLFKAIVGFALIMLSYWLAGKYAKFRIW